ncbi:hypothetical protein Pan258_53900 [Symmachiella dynata]|uniref:hypothetical protein n=1 Tax=Symmachiella dynata TaxID=2527995 RepID=UPI001189815B|nr:hypothetical protein [Symmachiella dynata]QDT51301.1 hypothetical protein Pan258_53900 [Symmachiella dynata]
MLKPIKNIVRYLIKRRHRKVFREGCVLSRFIARDIRREVMILSAHDIDDGFVTARIRTTNVMYLSRGVVSSHAFGPPQRIAIDQLWVWSGQPWGGLADGTSIADKI